MTALLIISLFLGAGLVIGAFAMQHRALGRVTKQRDTLLDDWARVVENCEHWQGEHFAAQFQCAAFRVLAQKQYEQLSQARNELSYLRGDATTIFSTQPRGRC